MKVVFCNILRGGGGNNLVEENRGKKYSNVKIEKVLRELENADEENQIVDLLNYDGFDEEEGIHQIYFEYRSCMTLLSRLKVRTASYNLALRASIAQPLGFR